MVTITAQYGCKMLEAETKQAVLNGETGEEKIYIRPPDWWPQPVPQGHALLLMKSMYRTRQARQWHQRISGWMESHDYMAVNNEKIMYMKWEGSAFIMHGLFVDEMAHSSTSQKMNKKFMKEYSKDFEYNGVDFMTSFLGLEVEQDKGQIRLHLNTHVNDLLEEYIGLKPKKIPMQPGVV